MDHILNLVLWIQVLESKASCLISGHVENLVDLSLERLKHIFTRSALEPASLRVVNSLLYFSNLLLYSVMDIYSGFLPSNCVLNSNGVTVKNQK